MIHKNIKTDPESLLKVISPFLPDIALAVECIFTWYWVSDFCSEHDIPFVLGHALYMKAIHGAKTKNDKIDSHKIAVLLRGGMIPMAYVYPAKMRATRDLLRRRMFFKQKRSELLAHIQNTRHQYLLSEFKKKIAYKANREGIAEQFPNSSTRMNVQTDLDLLTIYDKKIQELELFITHHAKEHNPQDLFLLRTVPGIGSVLSLVIKQSAGKTYSGGNGKIGNAYLKWSFSEAATLFIRENDEVKKYHQELKNKHGKAKAMAILSHRIGRAVYYILKNKQAFHMNQFL